MGSIGQFVASREEVLCEGVRETAYYDGGENEACYPRDEAEDADAAFVGLARELIFCPD